MVRCDAVMYLVFAITSVGCATHPVATHGFDASELSMSFGSRDTITEIGWPASASSAVVLEDQPSRSTAVFASAESSVRHVTLLVGSRDLRDSTAKLLDIDQQTALGIEYDQYDRETGNGFEFGFQHSTEDNTVLGLGTEASLDEFYGGFRKTFRPAATDYHPYVAVGLAYINADFDFGPISDSDSDIGPYARVGILWQLGENSRLGLDYRRLFGTDLSLVGGKAEGDYSQFALTFGVAF